MRGPIGWDAMIDRGPGDWTRARLPKKGKAKSTTGQRIKHSDLPLRFLPTLPPLVLVLFPLLLTPYSSCTPSLAYYLPLLSHPAMQRSAYSMPNHQPNLQQFTSPDSLFIFPESFEATRSRDSFPIPASDDDYSDIPPNGWSPKVEPIPLRSHYSSNHSYQPSVEDPQSSWHLVHDQPPPVLIASQCTETISPVDYRVDLTYTLPSAPSTMQAPQPTYPTPSVLQASYPPAPVYQDADGTATSVVEHAALGHSRNSSWLSTVAASAYTMHPEAFQSSFDGSRPATVIGRHEDFSPFSENQSPHQVSQSQAIALRL